MSDRYSYRNLILWQRAQELAYDILQIVKRFPQTWASAVIGRQIIGAATSIGANIAEGHGRFTIGAHRNHLSIARGSATETDSWLDLMRREGIISQQEEESLHGNCRQLIAMLTTKINAFDDDSSKSGKDIREETLAYDHSGIEVHFPFQPSDYIADRD